MMFVCLCVYLYAFIVGSNALLYVFYVIQYIFIYLYFNISPPEATDHMETVTNKEAEEEEKKMYFSESVVYLVAG